MPADRLETTLDPDVQAWRNAFVAANKKAPDILPVYERGWFIWRSAGGWITGRNRRCELIEMTGRLKERANG